jgi:hypothetical protein
LASDGDALRVQIRPVSCCPQRFRKNEGPRREALAKQKKGAEAEKEVRSLSLFRPVHRFESGHQLKVESYEKSECVAPALKVRQGTMKRARVSRRTRSTATNRLLCPGIRKAKAPTGSFSGRPREPAEQAHHGIAKVAQPIRTLRLP